VITVPFRVDPKAAAGERALGLRVVFQPCDGASCRPPLSAQLEVPLTIEPAP